MCWGSGLAERLGLRGGGGLGNKGQWSGVGEAKAQMRSRGKNRKFMFFKDQGASRDLSFCPLSLSGLKTITFLVKGWGWHHSKHWASLRASAKHRCVPGTRVTATLFQCLPSAHSWPLLGSPGESAVPPCRVPWSVSLSLGPFLLLSSLFLDHPGFAPRGSRW